MPSTIKNHAIDYNKDGSIDLKNIEDSFASAANYLSNLGWNDNTPCFYRINLNENIPDKYLNTSAKKIKHERKVKYLKNYIKNSSFLDKYDNMTAAIITPDAEIVENAFSTISASGVIIAAVILSYLSKKDEFFI